MNMHEKIDEVVEWKVQIDLVEANVGTVFKVVRDGAYCGTFKVVKNWCKEIYLLEV